MTFEERVKEIERRKKLIAKNAVAIEQHEFVIAKKKLISKHQNVVDQLIESCTHDQTYATQYYFGGSYLDRALTTYYTRCILCDKLLYTKEKTHDYYG